MSTTTTKLEHVNQAEQEAETYSTIGKRVPKYDSLEKVTGRAEYLIDLKLPGMLHGKILHSRYPHARVLKIDTSKAESLPGVVTVITSKDTPKIKFGFMKDNLPLKDDVVLSYRDEVAAVAAIDEPTASKALDLIEVEYEQLPSVFDVFESMKEGAPTLHESSKRNVARIPFSFRAGDPEAVFSEFEKKGLVFENEFSVQFMTHTALGTMGTLATYDSLGKLTVYANTQAPFMFQREIAQALGIPGDRVRVIQPYIGGAFGRGMDVYPIDIITCLLSMKTGKPVKLIFSREEDLSYSPTRQPAIFKLKTAVSQTGKLLARKVDIYLDTGAYVSWGAFDSRVMMATASGQYRVENLSFDSHVVYTNNPYSGTMRGAGNPQINFAIESQMDIIAEKLGIDPLALRILNANRPGDVSTQGMRITTCPMEETMRVAAKEIGWKKVHGEGKNRGIGFSTLFHVAGGARVYKSDGCGAMIKIDDYGKVSVAVGTTEIGTGSDTSIAQIVAEELGIPLSMVEIVNNDTALKPWDVGTHASRATFIGGNAALLAAKDAKRKILEVASREFLVDPSSLKIKDGEIFSVSDPEKKMEYSKLLRHNHFRQGGSMIMASAFYDPPTEMSDGESFLGNISMTYSFGTQAVLVEVDEETGRIEVKKVVAVHDGGRILNPNGAEGQIEGGVVMSLGYALCEELILDEGMVVNPSFADYKLMTSMEVPEIKVHFVGEPDPSGPFGAKGLGEHGCIPTAAALANAVNDAVGARIFNLPITPDKVVSALNSKH